MKGVNLYYDEVFIVLQLQNPEDYIAQDVIVYLYNLDFGVPNFTVTSLSNKLLFVSFVEVCYCYQTFDL